MPPKHAPSSKRASLPEPAASLAPQRQLTLPLTHVHLAMWDTSTASCRICCPSNPISADADTLAALSAYLYKLFSIQRPALAQEAAP